MPPTDAEIAAASLDPSTPAGRVRQRLADAILATRGDMTSATNLVTTAMHTEADAIGGTATTKDGITRTVQVVAADMLATARARVNARHART